MPLYCSTSNPASLLSLSCHITSVSSKVYYIPCFPKTAMLKEHQSRVWTLYVTWSNVFLGLDPGRECRGRLPWRGTALIMASQGTVCCRCDPLLLADPLDSLAEAMPASFLCCKDTLLSSSRPWSSLHYSRQHGANCLSSFHFGL